MRASIPFNTVDVDRTSNSEIKLRLLPTLKMQRLIEIEKCYIYKRTLIKINLNRLKSDYKRTVRLAAIMQPNSQYKG